MLTGLCLVVGYDMLCSAPLDTTVLFCASQDVMCWVVLDVHFGLAVNVKLGDLMHPCGDIYVQQTVYDMYVR